ncbi:MAG: DegT/DnrJ/EryC1/StrS family aminotransferase [Armatimonadota bacterium]|nr:DegT/DnrJ/EryC1/StrS family aminotransferase [Armatimonadota bacterium]
MSEPLALLGGSPAVSVPVIDRWQPPREEMKRAVCELIDADFLSGSGTGLPKQFEEEFRQYVGAQYCLSVNHGSTALASAFFAVGVGPGDEVITPTLGYLGTYSGALHMGARPVFCDIDPHTLLVDPEDVEKRITARTKAIVPIHLFGNVCEMDALRDISHRYGIPIIEDAAHAHGAEWDGVKIGNLSHLTCFSLQGSPPYGKPVCGGEGGVVTTNHREYYERMLAYCHLHRAGITDELTLPEYRELDSQVLGLKWRAHPLALAIARVTMQSLDYRNARRAEFRQKVFEGLRGMRGIEPVCSYPKARPAGFYGGHPVIYHPEQLHGLSAQRFVQALQAEGVPVSLYDRKLEHQKTLFRKGFDLWGNGRGPLGGEFFGLPPFQGYREGDFPQAERVVGNILLIHPLIEPPEELAEQVVRAFEKVIAHHEQL